MRNPTVTIKCRYSSGLEAGLDEAGRGAVAGPIVAAAVVFPLGYVNAAIRDSKTLSPSWRASLSKVIQRDALRFTIRMVSAKEVDRLNPLQATMCAMHRCVAGLGIQKDLLLLVDGNYFKPYAGLSHICIIKGDAQYTSIAAAGILAKHFRDQYMCYLHHFFPAYGFSMHKGYLTAAHKCALRHWGRSSVHRYTFRIG